nr:hypothetical protein [Tanacetum cinerariifolium]
MYFVEHCARKGDLIRSPMGIGAGLRERLAPMKRPDKIRIGDQDNNHTILSFDLSKEEFKEFPLPAAFPQFDSWEEFLRFSGDKSSKERVVFRHDSYMWIMRSVYVYLVPEKVEY